MRAPFRFDIGLNKKQKNPEERFTLLHTLSAHQTVNTANMHLPTTNERPPACKMLCVCLLFLAMFLPIVTAVYLITRSEKHSASSEREAAFAKRSRVRIGPHPSRPKPGLIPKRSTIPLPLPNPRAKFPVTLRHSVPAWELEETPPAPPPPPFPRLVWWPWLEGTGPPRSPPRSPPP